MAAANLFDMILGAGRVTDMMLSHESAGAGPAVLLLHSGVCDRRMWDPQWQALIDSGHRAVRCDFPGYGETPAADRPFDTAADVLAVLDALEIREATLVGSSYGGRVALQVAARWPDRVHALVLLCAGMPGHEPSERLRAYGEREDALIEAGDVAGVVEFDVDTWLGPSADEQARDRVRLMLRHALEVQLAAGEEVEQVEPPVDLSAIRARCLAVSGPYDFPDFTQIAAEIPTLLPQARHVELPWAGHLPSLERPDEVTELLLAFLRETTPPNTTP
jgi:3-oxoadipate enol-lactonase